jgi:hypothetical protein
VGPSSRGLQRRGLPGQQLFSVGNAFNAELVDVFVDETTIQVWCKNYLIKTVAR